MNKLFLTLLLSLNLLGGFEGNGSDTAITTNYNGLKTANAFTIAVWFKTDATAYGDHIVWQGDSAGNGWGGQAEMHLSIGNYESTSISDVVGFWMGSTNDNADDIILYSSFTDTSAYHHIVVTVATLSTNPTGILYVDGTQTDTDTGSVQRCDTDRTNWDQAFTIGQEGATSREFDGVIADVVVWETVLTATQISLLYSSKMKRLPLQIPTPTAYWALDDISEGTSTNGVTFVEYISGNDGTGVNGTAVSEKTLSY